MAIVQGSTPCPLTHCFDERRATYEMHLALTRSIPEGSVDLVVWPEGSTGGFDADPVLNDDVSAAIGGEAARIGAYLLAGGDRPVSDEEWINANVMFGPDGRIVGEYRKRHPVPFGEYIPARPLFEWIPALDQVPRDMIAGTHHFVFGLAIGRIGSVISFEADLRALRTRRGEKRRSDPGGGHERGQLRIHPGLRSIHRHDADALCRARPGGGSLGGHRQVDVHHRWQDRRGGGLSGGEGHHCRAPTLQRAPDPVHEVGGVGASRCRGWPRLASDPAAVAAGARTRTTGPFAGPHKIVRCPNSPGWLPTSPFNPRF